MRKLLLVLSVLLMSVSAIAGPSKNTMALGKGMTMSYRPGHSPTHWTSFSFSVGTETLKTDGDPQVHWKGKYFYWPAKVVVYVLPHGVRVIGEADSRKGDTKRLIVLNPKKAPRVIEFMRTPHSMNDIAVRYNMKKTILIGKRSKSMYDFLISSYRDCPQIIWCGAKKGWKVMWGRAIQKIKWIKVRKTPSVITNPVTSRTGRQ